MPQHSVTARPSPPARIDSRELLASGKRLLIRHRGDWYELRETRNGKLILTK